MKSKEERQARLLLNLFFTVISFCVILLSLIFAGVIVYFMWSSENLGDTVPKSAYLLKPILIMVLISCITGMILSWFASRISLRPLEKAINKINRLSCGDYKVRLQYNTPFNMLSDFRELSDSFNKLAEELDSTEMLRSDFINNFSHEFKTPIVSIAGFAKLLKQGNLSKKETLEYLDIIEKESLRLSDMATNVLNLTRVENQTILTDVKEYNVSEQIRTCILMFIDKCEAKNLEIKANFEEYDIIGNKELLKQVWINLMENAIKFSSEGGTIDFTIKKSKGKLYVSVANTGETIPLEKQQQIFRKFYQVDESHAKEGNGIGLAIVKKIVELHKGEVSVHSEKETTVFTVELPADM